MAERLAAEVGSAYLALIPTMKGAKRAIEAELNNAGITSIASKAGKNFGANFTQNLDTIAPKFARLGLLMTAGITAPALAAASALGGIVVTKGFKRVAAIDEASSKLRGLGHDAQATKSIMDSALESVLGTAYGLDAAATTAAGAVAAGVGQGEQLTKYLKNVGDAAAIAGVPMEEMGSIFNRTQTAGRAYAMELNMLADRGLPIYQWIAKEAGITAGAVRDMAAEGKVSSELYFKAIEKNIGGAAKYMGENSFSGIVANTNAAISRIGANILGGQGQGGLFEQLKPQIVEFKAWLGEIELKAKDWGVLLGAAAQVAFAKFRELLAVFQPMNSETKSLAEQTEQLKATMTRVFDAIIEKVKGFKAFYDGLGPSGKKFIQSLPLIAIAAGPAITAFAKLATAISAIIKLSQAFKTMQIGTALTNSIVKSVGLQTVSASNLTKTMQGLSAAFKGASMSMSGFTVGAAGLSFAVGYMLGQPIADYLLKIQDASHKTQSAAVQNQWLETSIGKLSTAYARAGTAVKAHKDALEMLKDAQTTARGMALSYERAVLGEERAHRQVAEALKMYGDGSLEHREALLSLAEAQDNLVRSQADMETAAEGLASANGAAATAAREAADAQSKANHEQVVYLNEMREKFKRGEKIPEGMRIKFEDEFKKLGNMRTNTVGEDLMNGVISGMRSKEAELKATAEAAIRQNVRPAMINAAMIKSPSRMTREIGEFIGQGLIVGLKAKFKPIRQTAQNLIKEIGAVFKNSASQSYLEAYLQHYDKMLEASDKLNELRSSPPKEPKRKKSQSQKDWDKELRDYQKELKKWKSEVEKAAKEIEESQKRSGKNLAKAFASGINAAVASAKKGDGAPAASALDELIGYTRGALRTKLQGYQKALESAATSIERINTRLDEQKQLLKDYKADIKGRFTDFASEVFSMKGINAKDYIDALKERLDASKTFSIQTQKLAGMGLSQAAIDAIAANGIEEGSAIMEALLTGATKANISELNSLYSETEAIGTRLGNKLGAKYIQPGIDALQEELTTAKEAATTIGASIADAVKSELDKAGDWGSTMVSSLATSIKQAKPVAVKAAEDLAKAVSKAAEIKLPVASSTAKPSTAKASASTSKPATTTSTNTNNNVYVTVNMDSLKDVLTFEQFIGRMKRAGVAYGN